LSHKSNVTLLAAARVLSPAKLPLPTVKVAITLEPAESTSAMLMPVKSVVTSTVMLMLAGAEIVGASLTAVTVIEIVAGAELSSPPLTLKVKLSGPM
jgi:hypothetical protein